MPRKRKYDREHIAELAEKTLKELKAPDDVVLVSLHLKKYFPLRRTLTEILTGRRRIVKAVDDVTFYVREGEIFCVAGESGCGKTTLGRTLIGLLDITAGYVLYKPRKEIADALMELGFEPVYKNFFLMNEVYENKKGFKLMRKEMQIIFQDPYGSLDPRHTIQSILAEPLVVHNIGTPEERLERVKRALEDVKLIPPEDFINRYPHQLSGGQRQRIVVARALMLNPRFVVADEPVSMLDVSIRAEILNLMLELKKKYGLTYLFITHDLALARLICDRIAIMYLGRIVELGPTDEIIENPQHPYTKALRAAILEPEPQNRFKFREVPIKGEVPSAVYIPPGCRFHPRCLSVMKICTTEQPTMVEVSPGHYVECWLFRKQS